jgi:hypothetical protein
MKSGTSWRWLSVTFMIAGNLTSYEIGGNISEQEAEEMAALAEELHNRVRRWLKSKHPMLL